MAKAVFTHADGSIHGDRPEERFRRFRLNLLMRGRRHGAGLGGAGRLIAPALAAMRPHPCRLDFHRRQVFKG